MNSTKDEHRFGEVMRASFEAALEINARTERERDAARIALVQAQTERDDADRRLKLQDALLAQLSEKVNFYEVQYQDEQGLNGAREERDAALAEAERCRRMQVAAYQGQLRSEIALGEAQRNEELLAQQIVDQAEALGQEKAEVQRLTTVLAERDAEIARLKHAVQQLAQEIENVMRHNEAPPGANAMEIATNVEQEWYADLQDGEFRVPIKIRLRLIAKIARAIEAAEARGRATNKAK
jgi:hypothetical protein